MLPVPATPTTSRTTATQIIPAPNSVTSPTSTPQLRPVSGECCRRTHQQIKSLETEVGKLITQNQQMYEMLTNLVANSISNKRHAPAEPEDKEVQTPAFPITTKEEYQDFNARLLNKDYAQRVVSEHYNLVSSNSTEYISFNLYRVSCSGNREVCF